MQIQSIQITQLTPEQFEEVIKKVVKSQFESILKELPSEQKKEDYLTRKQVIALFQIPYSTMYNWINSGKLKPYGIGNRVYFLRSDIEKALTPLNQDGL